MDEFQVKEGERPKGPVGTCFEGRKRRPGRLAVHEMALAGREVVTGVDILSSSRRWPSSCSIAPWGSSGSRSPVGRRHNNFGVLVPNCTRWEGSHSALAL
ncbi:uncharacterized protein CIMG_11384 [Coccidioides immitis RS]|uniref:Uncharacterized protein n=4 Tax=Coccidioides immitis TaxID=5501 RepID=A0A0D8JUK1_COCIM|nr:uncharacterized protein CIMG_11384 [Coccidioides immitis RS]KJF61030.1 hypothetical protein CIMG_11384 [Coccidioides immitis RS]KMP04900.1 hypothetical protein CIRG_04581 [Coccidioides immitis RMSCC 2394]KMU78096.1 hypothetical protein CISG_06936 [Coccidioides immitis RMSCC 3703]KMU86402.1 hypothetical protein CIHG_04191 [Coccidioides immitis H538.4]